MVDAIIQEAVKQQQKYNALWLPRGSVRAIIALILLSSIIYLLTIGISVPDTLWTLTATCITFYFTKPSENGGYK